MLPPSKKDNEVHSIGESLRTEDQFTLELRAAPSDKATKNTVFGLSTNQDSISTSSTVSSLTDDSHVFDSPAKKRRKKSRRKTRGGGAVGDGLCGPRRTTKRRAGSNYDLQSSFTEFFACCHPIKEPVDQDDYTRTTAAARTRATWDTEHALLDRVEDEDNKRDYEEKRETPADARRRRRMLGFLRRKRKSKSRDKYDKYERRESSGRYA